MKKTILICSNYAWTIVNFRLSLINEFKKNGYRVEVITQYDGHESSLEKLVDKIHPLYISRKGLNPIVDFITFLNLLCCFIKVKPSIYLPFTIKPVIYGSLVAKILNIHTIATITGLGTAFIRNTWVTKLVKKLYLFSLKSVAVVFFQNTSDRNMFIGQSLLKSDQAYLIPGSGIDTSKFSVYKTSGQVSNQVIFILIARLLWDKGIGEYVSAARKIKIHYPEFKFQLLGPLGVENRTSISKGDVEKWHAEGVIEYLGEARDVRPFISNASCVALPSYREGLSRVLLEASAMSKPIIATDVPGCREVVDDKVTGFLCKVKNVDDLAEKMVSFISLSNAEKIEMGAKGREKVALEFSIEKVCRKYLKMIDSLHL